MFEEFGINAGFVEDLHAQYRQSPASVDDEWRTFFDAFESSPSQKSERAAPAGANGGNGTAAHTNGTANGNGNGSAYSAPALPRINGAAMYGLAPVPERTDRAVSGARDERLLAAAALQGRVYQLVNAYRVRGHLFSKIDPLGTPPDSRAPAPELELANFGLTEADYDVTFPTVGMSGIPERATLREIINHLSETYCGSIGVEFTHIEEP
jgi:2-oxoglutarate dehydrogenase E1 component